LQGMRVVYQGGPRRGKSVASGNTATQAPAGIAQQGLNVPSNLGKLRRQPAVATQGGDRVSTLA